MPLMLNYITGYAGTGKSTKLIELTQSLPIDSTIVIAPTHKALARLSPTLPPKIEIKTIHSLLGWIPTINEKAKTIYHIDSIHKLDKPLESYNHIVIDEAGMMNEDMLFEITSKIEDIMWEQEQEEDITLHLFLDPYQLLPIKGQQIQTDPTTTTNLTTQYRSESKDIVALYTKFVHYLEGTNTKDLTTPYSTNVKPLDIKKFKREDRLLAYTNKAVGMWNQRIAKHLDIHNYINQEVQLGNMLDTIICKEFIDLNLTTLLLVYKKKLILQNSNIAKQYLESSLDALIQHKDIKFIIDNNGFIYPVILGIDKAYSIIKKAKEKAINNRKLFRDVYTLGRAFIMDYTFATTVHKAQGSEFNTVFIDKSDIKKSIFNNYYNNYARLMYVGLSRAKNLIYI